MNIFVSIVNNQVCFYLQRWKAELIPLQSHLHVTFYMNEVKTRATIKLSS